MMQDGILPKDLENTRRELIRFLGKLDDVLGGERTVPSRAERRLLKAIKRNGLDLETVCQFVKSQTESN